LGELAAQGAEGAGELQGAPLKCGQQGWGLVRVH
jgi:hypothetical protein